MKPMIIYINCCPRAQSRTNELARALLAGLGEYKEIKLYETELQPLNEERLALRTELIERGDYSHPMFDYAKEFASADIIVIGAPFWDGSFPSMLKVYLENIYVTGLTSEYGPDGQPVGLCKADTLYYVSTAGGPLFESFGYDYIRALALQCFGIKETRLIKAEMLDVWGSDPKAIIDKAKAELLKGEQNK